MDDPFAGLFGKPENNVEGQGYVMEYPAMEPVEQLVLVGERQYASMLDALDQAERTLDWLARAARFHAPDPLTLNRGMLTSIGIARVRIRRAR